jgi:cardiolipin synthase
VGFIGGAGIASHWTDAVNGAPPWRDTMVRVTGSVVAGLQSAFLENWLEATGEILIGRESFPLPSRTDQSVPAIVVTGTPSPARASRARVLFQVLLATARESIEINSPYFLPDRSARRELCSAAARNVHVRVIVPGRHNNHPITRLASRRQYGKLLAGGVEIFEYQPGMIHAKIMIIDRRWAVVGSTNFDSRSFEINDEVNLAVASADVAARLGSDFDQDLRQSRPVTREESRRRSMLERIAALACIALERQE